VAAFEQLISAAREAVEVRRREVSQAELESRLSGRSEGRPFRQALAHPGLSLIAEFKRRSPSAGEIAPSALVADRVGAYERGGAAALSILTDEAHFGGSLADLRAARAASLLPILRKDFILDPYQLYEAADGGADAVLLIVRALDDDALRSLRDEANAIGLDCLVEVHDATELERALELGAELIGINNRDLEAGTTDLATTCELMPAVPPGRTVVAESGISTPGELARLARVGVDAVLIGGALMGAADPEAKAAELTGADRPVGQRRLP